MISKNLGYILGALRDGSLPNCGTKKEVTLATDLSRSWLQTVAQKAADEFSIPISRFKTYEIWDRKSVQPCFRLKIYSKEVYERLAEFYEPGDQVFWSTPAAVKAASRAIQKEYVAAFYDAEGGCRNVSKFQRNITRSIHCWCSIACKHSEANEPLLFIHDVLGIVGVRSQIYESNELMMTGRENMRKFYESFPLQHERKREQLKHLLLYFGALSAKA